MSSPQLTELALAIPLRKRNGTIHHHTIIDASDADTLLEHHWYFDGRYPACRINGIQHRMHRVLLNPPHGKEVDHINGNTLDNRRDNLRVVTHAINGKNTPGRGGTSKYRGVSWDKARGQWRAQAKLDFRAKFLGRFDTEEEAVAAVRAFWEEVDEQSLSHHGAEMEVSA